MKLNYETYKDKVLACWTGKNIGGTLGGPYEGVRKSLNVTGFSTQAGEALPNDDLDLQLIWLHAVEKEGAKNIDAATLGEYWLSYIPVYMGEYAIARRNMEIGVVPPLSGETQNNHILKHSNGAWIRTEIWACLFPASPDLAARYAIEDAKIDHGIGEGTYAAMFVAAVESAAFVVSDVRKLVEIGLAKVPKTCRLAQSIRLLFSCYDGGMSALETREAILRQNADIGDGWFSAPSNVAYAMLGILYGEGDFKKSMLLAVNCGDDTDCTAATVGSIFGIMHGTKGIPQDWATHVGDRIVTCCINLGTAWEVIDSCKQLTDRVTKLAPVVLYEMRAAFATELTWTTEQTEVTQAETDKFLLPYGQSEESEALAVSVLSLKNPNTIVKRCSTVTALVTVHGGAYITAGEQKRLSVSFQNNIKAFGNQPHNVNVQFVLPDGWTASNDDFDVYVPTWMSLTENTCHSVPTEIVLTAPEKIAAHNRILMIVSEHGRAHVEVVSVVLLNRPSETCYQYPEKFTNYGL